MDQKSCPKNTPLKTMTKHYIVLISVKETSNSPASEPEFQSALFATGEGSGPNRNWSIMVLKDGQIYRRKKCPRRRQQNNSRTCASC